MGMANGNDDSDCERQERANRVGKVARRVHKVSGWMGALLFVLTAGHGAYLGLRYAGIKATSGSVAVVPVAGVGGIIIVIEVLCAIYAVKVKRNYGLHKDLMMAAIIFLFTGTGAIRWVDDLTTALIPNDFVGGLVEAFLVLGLIYPGLLIGTYWRARRLEDRSYAKKLLSGVILLPVIVTVCVYLPLML